LDLFQRASPAERTVKLGAGERLLATETVALAGRALPVDFIRHPKARVYRLLLRREGVARVTVPRFGTLGEARNFLMRHAEWLESRYRVHLADSARNATDPLRPEIRFRGGLVPVSLSEDGKELLLGEARFPVPRIRDAGLPARASAVLRKLAATELPARVAELSSRHGIGVTRVAVRNQRTRWGSCSPRGVVSLNWRLVQVPEAVRDYVILHELAHRRHMNHSERFWDEVRRLCPDFEVSERWLRENSRIVL
jgi:predicted metal-dependent hydrolase